MRRKILATILVTLATILALELGLRAFGRTAYAIPEIHIESTPSYAILPDSLYGFKLNDGRFQTTLNGKLTYTATHVDGCRITAPQNEKLSKRPVVGFFGGSLTYGYGVDDSQSFPYLLQNRLPDFDIKNHGVPGYGTVQTLLKLRITHQEKNFPEMVVLCYANFHQERDQLTPSYQEKISIGFEQTPKLHGTQTMESWSFPYARLDNGQLTLNRKKVSAFSRIHFLRRNSALFNQVSLLFQRKASSEETHSIIREIHELCSQNRSKLVLASLTKDSEIEQFCKDENIEFWDIFVPWDQDSLNLLPYDPHPNARAHQQYAKLIISQLTP